MLYLGRFEQSVQRWNKERTIHAQEEKEEKNQERLVLLMGTFLSKGEKRALKSSAEKSLDLFRAGVKFGKAKYSGRKESARKKRFERARIVHALRESNLPAETQRSEIAKLGRSKFSKIFGREKPKSKAFFGIEAEK